MAGFFVRKGIRSEILMFVEKPERRRSLGKRVLRRKDNIKMDCKEKN